MRAIPFFGRPRFSAAFLALAMTCTCLLGCRGENRLETGYQYQPLSSSEIERRAFYADPYSIAARRAEEQRQQRQRDGGSFLGGG